MAGCASALLFLFGILMGLMSTIGFILGLFKQKMRFKGIDMGLVDLPTYLGLIAMAAIALGLGYGIDWLQRRRNRKDA